MSLRARGVGGTEIGEATPHKSSDIVKSRLIFSRSTRSSKNTTGSSPFGRFCVCRSLLDFDTLRENKKKNNQDTDALVVFLFGLLN